MDLYITRVHVEGSNAHEHITKYEWQQGTNGGLQQSPRGTVVARVESGDHAFTKPTTGTGAQAFVRELSSVKFLQTHADNKWTNNLLGLDRF